MRAKLCKSFSSCNRGPRKHFLSLFIESEQMIQVMAAGGAIEIDLTAVPGELQAPVQNGNRNTRESLVGRYWISSVYKHICKTRTKPDTMNLLLLKRDSLTLVMWQTVERIGDKHSETAQGCTLAKEKRSNSDTIQS